jgi:Xaa-Pro aminopeptidase
MAAYDAIAAEARGAVLVPVRGVVERLREVKEPAEIECILKSVRLNSMAFEAGVAGMRDGVAEADVAAEIENAMRRRGAEAPAFESIVASGPRGALPHARASARVMRRGEAVVVDIGAMLEGYASDMTRAVFVGEPDATGRKVHGAVLDAVLRAEAEVRAGAAISKVDAAARDAVAAAGFGSEAYRHGTGHGVGLEVHEAPQVGAGAAGAVLEKGMVVTIEPGIYVPGWGGVRIEDVVVVEEGGCRVLTETPKTILTV